MKKLIIAALLSLALNPAFAWDADCEYISFDIDVLNCTATHQIEPSAHPKELFITHQENSEKYRFWFIDEAPYAADNYEKDGVVQYRLDGGEVAELGTLAPAGGVTGGEGFTVEISEDQAEQLFRSMHDAHVWRLSAPVRGEERDTYVHLTLSGFNDAISFLIERTQ